MKTYYIVIRGDSILLCTSTGDYMGHIQGGDVVMAEGQSFRRCVSWFLEALVQKPQTLKWAKRQEPVPPITIKAITEDFYLIIPA